jgi:hypothetical protein
MTFAWGATALPLEAPATGEAVTDKAITVVGAYLKAFINAYGVVAWQAVHKDAAPNLPVATVLPYNPEEPRREFNDKALPALFIWRASGDDDWLATDWRIETSVWKALWLFPAANQQKQTARDPFPNGLAKLVSLALKRGRDTSYQITGDADITALSVAALPTSLKTSIASAATAQTYSGAALNGSIGAGAISPQRAPTVTTGGSLAAFAPGSTVRFTGLNGLGSVCVSTATIGATIGTFAGDYDLASVTSIAVDGQTSTAGTLTFGTAARTGLGSVMMRHANLVDLTMTGWRPRILQIQFVEGGADQGRVMPYDAVEFTLSAVERLEEDNSDTGALRQVYPLAGVDVSYRREDTTEIEAANLDA